MTKKAIMKKVLFTSTLVPGIALFLTAQDGCPTEVTCEVDVTTGVVSCSDGQPVLVTDSSEGGLVLSIDMTDFEHVAVDADVSNASDWVIHVGNSPTNDGHCGDTGITNNDSEAWIAYGSSLGLCTSDKGGSETILSQSDALNVNEDHISINIADGQFSYESSTFDSGLVTNPFIFQIDGDEPDVGGGENDQILWLGLNTVVSAYSDRSGTGITHAVISLTPRSE